MPSPTHELLQLHHINTYSIKYQIFVQRLDTNGDGGKILDIHSYLICCRVWNESSRVQTLTPIYTLTPTCLSDVTSCIINPCLHFWLSALVITAHRLTHLSLTSPLRVITTLFTLSLSLCLHIKLLDRP